ncbi:MAG: UDP-N-acetylmuramate/alanine ligase, UDP-N-acetylmuramate-alanine ligase [Candidatus Moranbacteria bacterium GW2011_GWC1_45_18]|nr:MAG: UDP-N-acetylmuramate-L-alanine ligase [Candidatus Moranbacteria bacterium GW2011_GWC2_40_12]KKT32753.1 MAG: UDP-N-acetylmuramate-L-alanine ligase [Candidatus Moranbacteria bacterium GW2011_GWF2_44_10]KKT99141.1 MAG: UDP-N-acetylmuramate/alanine ligase, UDP-N-acetylmuramate-alanine ligase [Candidatus Moranbacteria bacterium GW2011_GWC1_45_18]OGI39721.1 MAG: UDP-N-acetylmuramate--L-alanine ligase [Candidatus Moranbacteria bacterium RIFOXYB1_FULL_44_23]OGI43280.1 MAG: UDP-N-acetylmuramate-
MIDFSKAKKIYFIGIKGSGMVALVEILQRRGCQISGSDTDEKFFTDDILRKKLFVKFHEGFDADHITGDIDLVVYSTAYNEKNNEEWKAARFKRLPMISYPELLGLLFNGKYGIAVSGTHGKTTTTAMLAEIFKASGFDPTAVVGSQVRQWRSSALVGRSEFMIIEADEYQGKFRYYSPQAVILTSVDWDHPDFFPTFEDYKKTFVEFVQKIPRHGFLVVSGDRSDTLEIAKGAKCNVLKYGFGKDNDLKIKNYEIAGGKQNFELVYGGKNLGKFEIELPGRHNALNAAAAVAMSYKFNADMKKAKEALANFEGTTRRFEYIGKRNGAILIDDYGHHPEEVKATLKAAREFFPKRRIWCVFHPHTFTRTKALLSEFAQSFEDADRVIILDIYGSAREVQGGVHSKDLVELAKKYHVSVEYIPTIPETVEYLAGQIGREDLVIAMGAGNVWEVAEKLVSEI